MRTRCRLARAVELTVHMITLHKSKRPLSYLPKNRQKGFEVDAVLCIRALAAAAAAARS